MTDLPIPPAIAETRSQIADAALEESDPDRRILLTRALSVIDWLSEHLAAIDGAYRQIRLERMRDA